MFSPDEATLISSTVLRAIGLSLAFSFTVTLITTASDRPWKISNSCKNGFIICDSDSFNYLVGKTSFKLSSLSLQKVRNSIGHWNFDRYLDMCEEHSSDFFVEAANTFPFERQLTGWFTVRLDRCLERKVKSGQDQQS